IHLAPVRAQHAPGVDEVSGIDLVDRLGSAPQVAVQYVDDPQVDETAPGRREEQLRRASFAMVTVVTAVALEVLRPPLAGLGVQPRHRERLGPAVVVADVMPPAHPDVPACRDRPAEAARTVAREEQPMAVVGELRLAIGPDRLALESRIGVDRKAIRLLPRCVAVWPVSEPLIEVKHSYPVTAM